MRQRHYIIAGLPVKVSFLDVDSDGLLSSAEPFRVSEDGFPEDSCLQICVVKDGVQKRQVWDEGKDFDTGNGITNVKSNGDKSAYLFSINDIYGNLCCIMEADKGFCHCVCEIHGTQHEREFGLNNALMMAYAYYACHRDALLIHASAVRHNGIAYPFVAPSGTGKSTHTSLWLKNIEGTDLINDDNPIIRIVDGEARLFGSPWSGKTPCYRNISAPLGAVTRIKRDLTNHLEPLKPIEAFTSLLESCSTLKIDIEIYRETTDLVSRIISLVPSFAIHCLPNAEAAMVCHEGFKQKKMSAK